MKIQYKNPLMVAREYRRQIAKLQAEREHLYLKALVALKVVDDNYAWDYLMDNQCGFSTFEERLRNEQK
jgi:hypothetical protein